MRKSLLNFQHFGQRKIEFGQGKVNESQGILFLTEGGHPVTVKLSSEHYKSIFIFFFNQKILIFCLFLHEHTYVVVTH